MRRPPFLLALAGATLLVLLGGASCRRAAPWGAHVVPCLDPSATAERLRDRVRELAAATDPDERARRAAYGLVPVAAAAAVAVERDPAVCTHAAYAYAAAVRTAATPPASPRPVVLVRAGPERYIAVDPTPDPRSEWSAALVFTHEFRPVGGFSF